MFCTNCGNNLEGSDRFCTKCGAPINNNLEVNTPIQNEGSTAASPKKNKKSILIIALSSLALLLIACTVGFFIYQNHIIKQADNVLAHLTNQEYDEALDIYNKFKGKKDKFDNKVSKELLNLIKQTKTDYLSENIDYYTALDRLNYLEDYKITEANDSINDLYHFLRKIKTSRENFEYGQDYYYFGDYQLALEQYKLVLEEDEKYYKLAQAEIKLIEEEEAQRQREEQINEIRNQALLDSTFLAYESKYEEAINVIEQGLSLIPGDAELTDKLTELREQLAAYKEEQSMSLKVPSFTSDKYEYTYKENDIELMNVSIEIPILEGDFISYSLINSMLQIIKENYINECSLMAEEAKLSMDDEFFITNSLDLSFNAVYNDNGILCIILEGDLYGGGAHGYPIKDAYTFDLNSGSPLGIKDLILVDEKEFASYILAEFQRMYDETPDDYWEEAPDTVESHSADLDNFNYYITEDSLCIYYFPYDLGSFGRGYVDIIIPYAGNEGMFSFLQ